MKRLLIVLIVILAATSAFSLDFSSFQSAYNEFAQDVATSLPFNTSLGLNWSDAYIGQLFALPPHLGVGITLGFTTMPFSAINSVLTALGNSLPSELNFAKQIGMPIPAYTLEARVGGLFLPFDVGVKIGVIPPGAMKSGSFTADYLLAGADLRFALLQERILLPAISIGAGLNVMRGHIALGGMMNGPITLANVQIPMGPLYDISLTDPTLAFNWETTVVDFKVQISKSLIILTPYVGAAASYALSSTAGGGLFSSLTVDDGTGPHPPTPADISNIEGYLSGGGSKVNLNEGGVTVTKSLRGSLAFRVFGGVSLNLLILKIDVGAMYNITSRSIGLSGNARLQL
jgi:hypothetical protein